MKASSNGWNIQTCSADADADADAAKCCADLVIATLKNRLARQPGVTLFVSGGQSPIPVFERLAMADIDWHRVDIHLVDERFAPENAASQNATLVRKYLLQRNASASRFHELIMSSSIDSCVQRANENSATLLQPDIVMLGMGLDGHTASLFPDAPDFDAAMQAQDHYVSVHPRNAPHARISMTHHWLSQAGELLLFIPGTDKWNAFRHFVIDQQDISPLQPLLKTLGASATIFTTGGEST